MEPTDPMDYVDPVGTVDPVDQRVSVGALILLANMCPMSMVDEYPGSRPAVGGGLVAC